MFLERDFKMKQEQINDQLRQRALERQWSLAERPRRVPQLSRGINFLILLIIALVLVSCKGPDEGGIVFSVATLTPAAQSLTETPPIAETVAPTLVTAIPAATATATPVAAATATVVPTVEVATAEPSRPQSLVRRINFPAGATSDVVSGRVGPEQRDVYLFRALAGQGASLAVTSKDSAANFTLSGLADGLFHKGASNPARQWQGMLPLTQDYIVVVTAPATTNYSLALAIAPLPATGSIRGLVWRDANRDDSIGDDEPVAGALVRLLDGTSCTGPLARTTTTAVGGAYAFYDLPAGIYCVEAITPEVTLSTLVELSAGEDAVDVNLMWPGPAPSGSIRGLVWRDTNRDDQIGDDEPVGGALVRLFGGANCSALLAETATTAVGGAYAFYDLPAGTYCVEASTTDVTASTLVELSAGENAVDINLMWPGPSAE